MNINKIAVFSCTTLALAALWWWHSRPAPALPPEAQDESPIVLPAPLIAEDDPTIARVRAIPDAPRILAAKATALTPEGGHYIETPWEEAEPDADLPLARPARGDIEFIASIALTNDALGQAQPGDVVGLTLPDGRTLQAKVTRTELQAGGRRNWQGEVEVEGEPYPVNFTFGKETAFGFIGTPQGSFTLETLRGQGWIYMTPPLDDSHTDELPPRS
ncbi:hypothetical protein ACL00X_08955 [Aeromonas diversa]|uniref:hypothetical protein n=1 Tax=Aeromonas diversa TaxID=502790 RepID=UPI0039A3B391